MSGFAAKPDVLENEGEGFLSLVFVIYEALVPGPRPTPGSFHSGAKVLECRCLTSERPL